MTRLIWCVATLLLSYIFLKIFSGSPRTTTGTRYRFKDPDSCRLVAHGLKLPDNNINMLSQYDARSLSNERLRVAFGIDNAFTSRDHDYIKDFIRKAGNRINLTHAEWSFVRHTAQNSVRRFTNKHTGNSKVIINLTEMVQVASLRVALYVLFDTGKAGRDEVMKDQDLINLAQAIHDTWIASKSWATIVPFEKNRRLLDALSVIFKQHDILDPRETPLMWILLAFETLWRIVLRGFLELEFRTGRHNPNWRATLIAFARNPTKRQFERGDENENEDENQVGVGAGVGVGVSACTLIKETLRLYPPTRRIYRIFKLSASSENTTVSADIEACQRTPDIWGPDALDFNPSRWTDPTDEQESSFLPFGSKPMLCPASSVFGPRAIGLLVGTLLDGLQGSWSLVSDDREILCEMHSKRVLSNDRNAYHDVFMVKRAA